MANEETKGILSQVHGKRTRYGFSRFSSFVITLISILFSIIYPSPTHALTFSNLSKTNVSVEIHSSRTSGVTPLSVFFEAQVKDSGNKIKKPFLELDYLWDFGDGKQMKGPLAAHVFESERDFQEFRVTLTVSNAEGELATAEKTIWLKPPTGNIRCVAAENSGDAFIGCPATSKDRVVNSNFTEALVWINEDKDNRVLLFRRGQTFYADGNQPPIPVEGPGIISSFGLSAEEPAVIRNDKPGTLIWLKSSAKDWRITDLKFIGNGDEKSKAISIDSENNLILRIGIEKFGEGIESANPHSLRNTVAQSNLKQISRNALFVDGEEIALMENTILEAGTDPEMLGHALHINYAKKVLIFRNTLGASDPLALKIQGRAVENSSTGNIVISENEFLGNETDLKHAAVIEISPTDLENAFMLENILFEQNTIRAGKSTRFGLQLSAAKGMSIRNNIFIATQAEVSYAAISIASDSSQDIHMYNNVLYRSAAETEEFCFLNVEGKNIRELFLKNNIASITSLTGPKAAYLIEIPGTSNLLQFSSDFNLLNINRTAGGFWAKSALGNHRLVEWQNRFEQDLHSLEGDPRWVNPDKDDFHLALGSPAKGAGTDEVEGVFDDLDGELRTTAQRKVAISNVDNDSPALGSSFTDLLDSHFGTKGKE